MEAPAGSIACITVLSDVSSVCGPVTTQTHLGRDFHSNRNDVAREKKSKRKLLVVLDEV